jgi:hypothetical protein
VALVLPKLRTHKASAFVFIYIIYIYKNVSPKI